ncbi:MAG: class I SAM-dependent methyltransferase [Fuerstiella sp.]
MSRSTHPIGRMMRFFHSDEQANRGMMDSPDYARGLAFGEKWAGTPAATEEGSPVPEESNPLWKYFCEHTEGPGIWKWTHYFDIYHRHLARFRGQQATLVEVGIYSGGSLGMWKSYFGSGVHIHGVDIEEACKCYEDEQITVHIGDQEDRAFWADFRTKVEGAQILIDDGGHTPDQQMVTLEEMLPSMPPGSVYVCEDIHGVSNRFTAFASGLVTLLNAQNTVRGPIPVATATPIQQSLCSIHFYPYVVVIEKNAVAPSRLEAPKNGTEWQPFLG